jgi:integrase
MVKTDSQKEERILTIINNIQERNLKAYATILYYTACRAGEILPYQHIKLNYAKQQNGKMKLDEYSRPIVESKEETNITYGINVDDIDILPDRIHFKKIPVFKTRGETCKEGIIWGSDNPLYKHILDYIKEKMEYRDKLREDNNLESVFLFESDKENKKDKQEDIKKFTWRFTKRLYLALKKVDPTFKIHTLRVSRATVAGDKSGDPFYVQSITGHQSIQMASEYTKSRNFMDRAKKYEGSPNLFKG